MAIWSADMRGREVELVALVGGISALIGRI